MVFEIDKTSGKIRCMECFQANPAKTSWINRSAAKRHLEDSNEHTENVRTNLERHTADATRDQHLAATYSALSYRDFDSTFPNPMPSVRPALFDTNISNSLDTTRYNSHNDNLFAPMDDLVIPAGVVPLYDDLSLEHERPRRS